MGGPTKGDALSGHSKMKLTKILTFRKISRKFKKKPIRLNCSMNIIMNRT